MKILIATKNPGKFEEIKAMLSEFPAEFVSLADCGIQDEFPENSDSFEENALGKARFYYEKSGLPTLADDSGLIVDALKNELGVKTRRWGAGEQASDEEWLEFFLQRMEKETNRLAQFVCIAAYKNADQEKSFRGESSGFITPKIEAPIKTGIPLSSVFKPNGLEKVYAALSHEQKNTLSHRGKAFAQLLHFLKNE